MTLSELADRIEAGETTSPMNLFTLLEIDPSKAIAEGWVYPTTSPLTSIDAAVKLLEEVLPEWVRAVDATAPEHGIEVKLFLNRGDLPSLESKGDFLDEARATVAAMLRAKEKQDDNYD